MITATKESDKKGEANKHVSLAAFKQKYLEDTDHKYEWKNGQIQQDEYMKPDEIYLIDNIVTKFNTTSDYQKGNRIISEADRYLSSVATYRRPDAAYLTSDQVHYPDGDQTPALVIEVSSPSNSSEHNIEKILEYFEAGVKLVWYIYPHVKQVWVFTHPKEVTVCHQSDLCHADPAIPGFSISVDEVFNKPPRSK